MFSAFRMSPLGRGRGLCDIESIFQSYLIPCEKLSSPGTVQIYRFQLKSKKASYRYIFVVQGPPSFPTHDLVTPTNTIYIT